MWDKDGNSDSDNICDNIKIKLGFYSGLGRTTMRNLDVQVKRASVQRGEDPGALENQRIHIPQRRCRGVLRATGWVLVLDPAKGRRMGNVIECQQQPDLLSAATVSWSSLIRSPLLSSYGKPLSLAKIFSTRKRAASSTLMLS